MGTFSFRLRPRLPAPDPTPEAGRAERLVRVLVGEMTRQERQTALGLERDEHFRKATLQPALDAGLVEMRTPGKPRSSKQRYRRTKAPKGS